MADASLAALLMEHPFSDDEELLFTVDRSLNAGDARTAARQTAAALRDLGVQSGQAVVVALPNGTEFVTTMIGVWLAGAVFVPMNPRFPEAEVELVLAATEPAALITADGTSVRPAGRRYDPGVAFVMWTSGTTGAPKAILHTHDAYLELLDRVLGPLRGRGAARATTAADRKPTPNLIPVSLALNAGIYNALFGLRAGAALVIMDRFEPHEFAELVRRFAIRSTVLPPTAMTTLADDGTVTDLTPLRYVRSITAPLSPLQARRFTEKFGAVVLNSYGQAEIGEVIGWTAADAREHPGKIGAVGRPHAGVDVKVVGDDGAPVPTDPTGSTDVGRLLVRPPKMAAGYATGEELRDRVDADGYVDTGDLGRVDADGFVWIEGRASDLVNRGGNKVFPEQVEEVLCLSPQVSEAAVVGVPDERLGEVPVAFVVGDASDDELEALCREHLVPYKVPVAFVRVHALPRTEVGKILRRELATAYRRPHPDVPGSTTTT